MSPENDVKSAEAILKKWGYEELTPIQEQALSTGNFNAGSREFIIGPTSSGKTAIPLAFFAVNEQKYDYECKLLYLVPYRALAVQKEHEIRNKFPNDKIVVSTSEYCSQDTDVLNGNCNIAIVIYEKVFKFLAVNSSLLQKYSHIVFDEMGIVENEERGVKVDYIFYKACNEKASSVFSLATNYYNWSRYINAFHFHKVENNIRPVELKNIIIHYDELNSASMDVLNQKIIEICRENLKDDRKILIFANSRNRVHSLSQIIYRALYPDQQIDLYKAKKRFFKNLIISEDDLYGIIEDDDFLAYECGIFFHNAALPEEIREVVEENFLNDTGTLNIVVSTETLAYGLNSNVDTVIVSDMLKPSSNKSRRFLTTNEYMNFIGRAGRLGKKKIGYTYTLLKGEDQKEQFELLQQSISNPPVVESNYRNIWNTEECIFYLLHFFNKKEGITPNDLEQQLLKFPCDKNFTEQNIKDSITQLSNRDLIIKHFCELDDMYRLKTSLLGYNAAGYVISVKSYDKLVNVSKNILASPKLYIFDFLYALCGCKEMQGGDKYDKSSAFEYAEHLEKELNYLKCKGKISYSLKKVIFSKNVIQKCLEHSSQLSPIDWAMLRRIRLADALYMWISGYSTKGIHNVCGFTYDTIKKYGEKAKYIIDIINIKVFSLDSQSSIDIQNILKILGMSLYYGVNPELIEQLRIETLEPLGGRQLRTISQYNHQYSQNSPKSKKTMYFMRKRMRSFPTEYLNLLKGYHYE